MPSQKTLDAFISLVLSEKHDQAIARYYTDDATMQENLGAVRKGRDTLVAGERAMLARHKGVRSTCVRPVLMDGDTVVIHWIFEFMRMDGSIMRMEELAHQRWDGEKIAEERFYYDPAQMRG